MIAFKLKTLISFVLVTLVIASEGKTIIIDVETNNNKIIKITNITDIEPDTTNTTINSEAILEIIKIEKNETLLLDKDDISNTDSLNKSMIALTNETDLINEDNKLDDEIKANVTNRFGEGDKKKPIYFANGVFHDDLSSTIVAKNIYNFGQNILSEILINRKENSEVISPLSIFSALSLIQIGAMGETLEELNTLMGFKKHFHSAQPIKIHAEFSMLLEEVTSDRDYNRSAQKYPEFDTNLVHNISVANGLFVNKDFKIRSEYGNAAKNVYQSEISSMDFLHKGAEAQKFINNWIDEKTYGKIKNLLPEPLTGDTQLVVVSALYFKANWWEEFGVEIVRKGNFYPHGKEKSDKFITVELMRMISDLFPYYDSVEYDCKIVGLKYQKQLTTMYMILPNNSNREKVIELQKLLTADKIDELIANTTDRKVAVVLPKFHVDNEVDLLPILKKLGLKTLFDPSQSDLSLIASDGDNSFDDKIENDYSNITKLDSLSELEEIKKDKNLKNPKLFVSKAIHKIDITVDEIGTEGGAATAFVSDRISGGQYFLADVPFLFVIRHEYTRLPIFYGAIFEPEFNNL